MLDLRSSQSCSVSHRVAITQAWFSGFPKDSLNYIVSASTGWSECYRINQSPEALEW